MPAPPSDDDPFELPIDGTLDLHAFRPDEVGSLVPEWLDACRQRGILQVRIVHGKGSGALRRTVAALLRRSPIVASFRSADEAGGGWGATVATLHPCDSRRPRTARSGWARGFRHRFAVATSRT